ncbi:N-alpha-acetyltransferase 80 [Stigmatopora argus]
MAECGTPVTGAFGTVSAPADERETYSQSENKPEEEIHAIPIHLRPDLLLPCADLVNSEWQRSQAARVHSLQKSCPDFPTCLVLVQGPGGAERTLGHARLSRVVGHGGSLFVESVVVSKAERGKGYGRTLMEMTEDYAKRQGFKRLCLTTHDKQQFYSHLGYTLSTPVQNAGAVASLVPTEMLLKLSGVPNGKLNLIKQTPKVEKCKQIWSNGPSSLPPPPPASSMPLPPPPPAPFMPLPPPPPSRPHLPSGAPVIQTLAETPYRDAKGASIFWMHKDL